VHPTCETSMHYFSCILVHLGHEMSMHDFHSLVGPVRIPQNARRDKLCQTCVFASDGICESHSAFQWAVKHRRNIFRARVGLVRIPQKAHGDTLCRTCIFASGGICWSRRAFRCIRGVKHRHTIFYTRVGRVLISRKAHRDMLR
jgi:hypothetical protein